MSIARDFARTMAPRKTIPVVKWRNCTVGHVDAGAALDGNAQVYLTSGDDLIPAAYLVDAYPSPIVGDVVRVQFVGGSPFIFGRAGGFPDLS